MFSLNERLLGRHGVYIVSGLGRPLYTIGMLVPISISLTWVGVLRRLTIIGGVCGLL